MSESEKKDILEEICAIQRAQGEGSSSSSEIDAEDVEGVLPDLHNAFEHLMSEGEFSTVASEDSEKADGTIVCEANPAKLFRKYWERNLDQHNEYLQAVFGPTCPLINRHVHTQPDLPPQTLIDSDDVHGLYVRMLEYRQLGRYREAFQALRPTLPYYANNHMVWTRMAEVCIFELYEETFDFSDMYMRIFDGMERTAFPSHRKQTNDIRQRHHEMNIRFAHVASELAYTLCKFSKSPITCLAATQNHAFLMLKLRKWRESLDASNYFLKNTEVNAKDEVRMKASTDQIEHVQLFKAEAKYYLGRYDRAIEYCHQVQRNAECSRLKMRAEMILAMSYLKKGNYRLAYQYVLNLVTSYRLDDMMVENVAQFGICIAHKMRNYQMVKDFLKLLKDIVV